MLRWAVSDKQALTRPKTESADCFLIQFNSTVYRDIIKLPRH